jgi:hypothetical protein
MADRTSMRIPRLNEYKVLLYRIALAYFFYFVARALFTVYNSNLIAVKSIFEFLELCWHGLAFDTTAILYVSSLFISACFFTCILCRT